MKNKKVGMISITVALVLMLTVVSGLGQGECLAAETRTIIDQAGRVVEIPKEVNRVVTLPMPFAAIYWQIVGSGDKIVGMNPASMAALENSILGIIAPELKSVPSDFVTGGFEVNVEELLKLKPDVVFQWEWMEKEIEKMEAVGIPVITVKYGTQEYLEGWIKIIGQMLGEEKRVSELLSYHHKTIEMISSRTSKIPRGDRPKALYLSNVNPLKVTGRDTYNHFWIEITGAVNAAESISGWGKALDMEQILVWDPDVIYISNFCEFQPEDILENKVENQDWSQVKAVKNRRVYNVPLGTYRWDPPNIESALMLKWLAQKQHPELFDNYDIKKEIKDFYLRFYHYELSSEEIDKIFHPPTTGTW